MEEKNYCSKCGAKLNPNDEFCNKCGSKLNGGLTVVMPGDLNSRVKNKSLASKVLSVANFPVSIVLRMMFQETDTRWTATSWKESSVSYVPGEYIPMMLLLAFIISFSACYIAAGDKSLSNGRFAKRIIVSIISFVFSVMLTIGTM